MAQCKANARTDLFRLLDLFLAEAHHGPDGALNPLCGLCGLCASAGVLLGLLGLLANLSADFAGGRFLGIGGFLVDGRRRFQIEVQNFEVRITHSPLSFWRGDA